MPVRPDHTIFWVIVRRADVPTYGVNLNVSAQIVSECPSPAGDVETGSRGCRLRRSEAVATDTGGKERRTQTHSDVAMKLTHQWILLSGVETV